VYERCKPYRKGRKKSRVGNESALANLNVQCCYPTGDCIRIAKRIVRNEIRGSFLISKILVGGPHCRTYNQHIQRGETFNSTEGLEIVTKSES